VVRLGVRPRRTQLSSQGTAIYFRSNGFLFRQPEEGDIYTILKYLALVYPHAAGTTEGPLDDTSYRVIFTRQPRRFMDAGWLGARVLTPENLPLPAAG